MFRSILQLISDNDLDVNLYVLGPSSIQFHSGPIKKLVDYKGWLNVLDPDFNIHVKENIIEQHIYYYYDDSLPHQFHLHFSSVNDKSVIGIFFKGESSKMVLKLINSI